MDFSYLGSSSSTTGPNSSRTFSGVSLGAANSNRYIAVSIVARNDKSIASATITSVTIGGQPATVIQANGNQDIARNIVAIAIAPVPTGATGDVVINFSAAAIYAINIGRYRVLSLSDLTAFDSFSDTSGNASGNLDIPENGFAIGVGATTAGTNSTWTGMSENYDLNTSGYGSGTGGSVSLPAGQTNRSVGITFPALFAPVGLFASFRVAKGGGNFLTFFT